MLSQLGIDREKRKWAQSAQKSEYKPLPINYKNYPTNWKQISLAVRTKANWRCEWCQVPNGTIRTSIKGKPYKVVLTVAHLGESKKDLHNTSNLAALCQVCHLREDTKEKAEKRKLNNAKML